MSGFAPLYDTDTGRSSAWAATGNAAHVYPTNVVAQMRDAFTSYTPNVQWSESKESGDLIYVDGNTLGASYLVISKDPLTAGTETSITSIANFTLPVELVFGISMSQRTLGQEFSVEFIDTGTRIPEMTDLAIAGIAQSTTTLTVDTVLAHGLTVGDCIGIRDCSNQLANYPALVVATTPSPTQFTATAGPGGTIPSQTVTNPAGAKGFVFFRNRMSSAVNGVSQIFENATVTNASLYIRNGYSDPLPSGTYDGNQSATVGTTASVALTSAGFQYAWSPTNEYRIITQEDRTQWLDQVVDSATSQATSRLYRTQICLDPTQKYQLRFKAVNNKSLTVPNAQIVSATKSGSTTATIVTATAHGLTTGDQVVMYGIRDQTNFANVTTATAVTVVDATTFTITIAVSATATSYGGFVAKVQGGNLMSSLGASVRVIQSANLTTASDGTRQLILVGSSAWTGQVPGDLVNIVGVRDNTTGASLGVDGAYKIANSSGTTLTLVLPYSGSMTLPADFAVTNCGGGVIKRTDLRIHYVRAFDYERERVEVLPRPSGDLNSAVPVVVNNSLTVTTANVQGTVQNNSVTIPNPVLTSCFGVSALPTTGTTSQHQRVIGTLIGVPLSKPYSIPELDWNYAAAASGILNTTTAVTIKTAAGAGLRNYITSIQVMSEALTNATELAIRDGAAGTVIWRTKIPTGGLPSTHFDFPNPLKGTANTLLEVVTLTASGAGAVYFNAQGYAAP